MDPNQNTTPPVQPTAAPTQAPAAVTPPPSPQAAVAPAQPVASQQAQSTVVKYAGFGRLAASIVDGILTSIIAFPLAILLGYNFANDDPMNLMSMIIGLVSIAYFIFFGARFGATPGKMLFKMKIVDRNYAKPSLGRIAVRESIGKLVTGVFLLVSCLFVVFHKQKCSLHDIIAGTYVVYK